MFRFRVFVAIYHIEICRKDVKPVLYGRNPQKRMGNMVKFSTSYEFQRKFTLIFVNIHNLQIEFYVV